MARANAVGAARPVFPTGACLLAAAFTLLGAFVAATYFYRPAVGVLSYDFNEHLRFAIALAAGKSLVPHTGFHWLLIGIAEVTPLDLRQGGVMVIAAATGLSAYLVYRLLEFVTPAASTRAKLWATGMTGVASALVLPPATNWYIGQGTANAWHNPTWLVMQPFGLAVVLLVLRSHASLPHMALAGLLTALSVFVKPNFALAFLPACWLWMLLRDPAWLAGPRNVLLSAPALLLLGAQLFAEYLNPDAQGAIILAPFLVWRHFSECVPCSLLMGIAFPAWVFIACRGRAWTSDAPRLAALTWLAAFSQHALFAESGPRLYAANWIWGYNFALKLLYVVAAAWLMRPETPASVRRVGWMLLALHATFGAISLGRAMTGFGFL